ncbi:thiamine phosphate synthase [Parabacteroides timonensis]|uniref:thiamine phosphate synthase n=1 Tax=Parabacteroides timonensis TaxID=1871013 RepID=UPI00094EA4A4|nr:thiamine phosphate synthase [Parabacteroides timonensis]
MKLIVITTPHFFEGESRILSFLFQEGMERLHLRKPQSNIDELRRLLETIPPEYYPRIVLHDHFELVPEYKLAGIHLNSRNYSIPKGFKGSISRSCHSLEEIHENRKLAYVFLSPIFQSISKEGYGSGFPMEVLQKAASDGIINEKVIALGGMDQTTIPLIKPLNFGGVAVLGALWGNEPSGNKIESIIERYKQLALWQ